MELRHLRTFLAVAEELHFGRAAERLHMAQPAVSQQIKALEKDLKVSLFERNRRVVELTDQGAALIGPAEDMLSVERVARRAVNVGRGEVVGEVRIAFGGVADYRVMPKVVRAVRTQLPGVELQLLNQMYANSAAVAVSKGQVDLGFSRLPSQVSDVVHRAYANERLMVIVPDDHWLAARESVRFIELRDEDFISYPEGIGSAMRAQLLRLSLDAGFYPTISQDAPEIVSIMGLVAAGVGITVHLDTVQTVHFDGVKFLHLEPEAPASVGTVCWVEENLTPAARAVLDVIEDVLPIPEGGSDKKSA